MSIIRRSRWICPHEHPCAGGEIVATAGIAAAYETGRGGITVRGRAFIEEEEAVSGRRGARKALPSSHWSCNVVAAQAGAPHQCLEIYAKAAASRAVCAIP